MKFPLLALLILAAAFDARAQGYITVGNHFGLTFRAPIYDAPAYNPAISISGQSSLGTPSGTAIYPGPLLQGTGYTFAVYFGYEGSPWWSEMRLLYSTTFRTAADNSLPAGLVFPQTVSVPGVDPGRRALLQVRVWNNGGGAYSSFWQATRSGASPVFLSEPLGGIAYVNGETIIPTPDMTGWTSFSIYSIPEPAPTLLAVYGAVALAWIRFRPRPAVHSRAYSVDSELSKPTTWSL